MITLGRSPSRPAPTPRHHHRNHLDDSASTTSREETSPQALYSASPTSSKRHSFDALASRAHPTGGAYSLLDHLLTASGEEVDRLNLSDSGPHSAARPSPSYRASGGMRPVSRASLLPDTSTDDTESSTASPRAKPAAAALFSRHHLRHGSLPYEDAQNEYLNAYYGSDVDTNASGEDEVSERDVESENEVEAIEARIRALRERHRLAVERALQASLASDGRTAAVHKKGLHSPLRARSLELNLRPPPPLPSTFKQGDLVAAENSCRSEHRQPVARNCLPNRAAPFRFPSLAPSDSASLNFREVGAAAFHTAWAAPAWPPSLSSPSGIEANIEVISISSANTSGEDDDNYTSCPPSSKTVGVVQARHSPLPPDQIERALEFPPTVALSSDHDANTVAPSTLFAATPSRHEQNSLREASQLVNSHPTTAATDTATGHDAPLFLSLSPYITQSNAGETKDERTSPSSWPPTVVEVELAPGQVESVTVRPTDIAEGLAADFIGMHELPDPDGAVRDVLTAFFSQHLPEGSSHRETASHGTSSKVRHSSSSYTKVGTDGAPSVVAAAPVPKSKGASGREASTAEPADHAENEEASSQPAPPVTACDALHRKPSATGPHTLSVKQTRAARLLAEANAARQELQRRRRIEETAAEFFDPYLMHVPARVQRAARPASLVRTRLEKDAQATQPTSTPEATKARPCRPRHPPQRSQQSQQPREKQRRSLTLHTSSTGRSGGGSGIVTTSTITGRGIRQASAATDPIPGASRPTQSPSRVMTPSPSRRSEAGGTHSPSPSPRRPLAGSSIACVHRGSHSVSRQLPAIRILQRATILSPGNSTERDKTKASVLTSIAERIREELPASRSLHDPVGTPSGRPHLSPFSGR